MRRRADTLLLGQDNDRAARWLPRLRERGIADDDIARIARDPRYALLLRRRGRFTWGQSAVMLIAYFGFILLIAFDKTFLAQPIGSGVTSLGIIIGFAIILLAITLTGICVRRANGEYDAMVADLVGDARA